MLWHAWKSWRLGRSVLRDRGLGDHLVARLLGGVSGVTLMLWNEHVAFMHDSPGQSSKLNVLAGLSVVASSEAQMNEVRDLQESVCVRIADSKALLEMTAAKIAPLLLLRIRTDRVHIEKCRIVHEGENILHKSGTLFEADSIRVAMQQDPRYSFRGTRRRSVF